MTIITILLAFFCDRYPKLQSMKKYHWFNEYAQLIMRFMPVCHEDKVPWWYLCVLVLPLLVIVFIIQLVSYELWFGLAGFVYGLIVLIYCLGNSRISQYLIGIVSKAAKTPVTIDAENVNEYTEGSVASFIRKTHQEIFAIIFWFILFGAVGALLYRMLLTLKTYSVQENSTLAPYQQSISLWLSVLNWPSVRLLSLCLSLGGVFTKAFPVWWQSFFGGLSESQKFLEDCMIAAVEQPSPLEVENLFYRAVFILLVVLALMTLASIIS